jgi:hypothetical protein
MAEPSRPTVKKLFAFSGNLCAFPKCKTPVVYPGSDSIVCEVCHIKGEKSTAARWDPNQSDEDRHGFDNLILLCGVHHKVVDDDEDAYTVERLRKMKRDHEMKFQGAAVDDALAERVAVLIQNNTITGGSIIHTQQQSGGQTAHSIVNNYGRTNRQIGPAVAEAMVAELRQYPGEAFKVTSRSQGSDTMQLARRIQELLMLSGWALQQNLSLAICPDTQDTEVILAVPGTKPSYEALLRCLRQAGMEARGETRPGLQLLEISVAEK